MLTTEEKAIRETIIAARKVQGSLWGDINNDVDFEEFRRMLRKRLIKMDEIKFSNPYWKTEARKRLLQVAAVAINAIGKIDGSGFQGSNLPEYAESVKPNGE